LLTQKIDAALGGRLTNRYERAGAFQTFALNEYPWKPADGPVERRVSGQAPAG
jgi:hypothetical protein